MAEFLDNLSPLLRLLVVLAVVVGAMRGRLAMGLALVAGALALGLLFPTPPLPWLEAAARALLAQETLYLLLVVLGILVFSDALNETGQIQRIIDAFQAMLGRSRAALVAFPALIGLLPMPGGALFSAPMVRAAVREAPLEPARTAACNYWFRHIWEYWFPLYPGVVLALALSGAPMAGFILLELPMTAWALGAGALVLLRGLDLTGGEGAGREFRPRRAPAFLMELAPIWIVVGGVFALMPFCAAGARRLPDLGFLVQNAPVPIALLGGLGWLMARRGLAPGRLPHLLWKRKMGSMVLLVLGLMVFKGVLEDSGAVLALRDEFTRLRVPLVLVLVALPFVCGLVVGIAVGYVGASFPLLLGLIEGLEPGQRLAAICLAYAAGYAGMMLSPVHICFVVTNQYFESRMPRMYRYLLPLALGGLGFALLLHLAYRALL